MCRSEVSEALLAAIDYANELQPEHDNRDPYFWSHSARYAARKALAKASDRNADWRLVAGVPNSGIHLCLNDLHVVRVLRSVWNTTPSPGRNKARRDAWQQHRQLQFSFKDGNREFPPTDLILDWTTDDLDNLVMHLGMPQGVWEHGSNPILAWRVPLPSADSLEELSFEGGEDTDVPVSLRIDEAEMEAAEAV